MTTAKRERNYLQDYNAYCDYRDNHLVPPANRVERDIMRNNMIAHAKRCFQAFSEAKNYGSRRDTVYTANGVLFFKRRAKAKPIFLARNFEGILIRKQPPDRSYPHSRNDAGVSDLHGLVTADDILDELGNWCRARAIPLHVCHKTSLVDRACAEVVMMACTRGL